MPKRLERDGFPVQVRRLLQCENDELAAVAQPTLNQRYAATEREQTRLNVMLFVNVFRVSRVPLPAHNGLVAGFESCRAHHNAAPGLIRLIF
jgi:hypothetical protein